MEPLPIGRQKLLKLPRTIAHRCIRDWLGRCYTEALAKHPGTEEEKLFRAACRQALQWLDAGDTEADVSLPLIEYIAQTFHLQQALLNFGLREHSLLPERTPDKPGQYDPAFRWSVALDNLRSAFNVGSVMRTVDHSGWQGVFALGATPGLDSAQVRKASMGSSAWISFQHLAPEAFEQQCGDVPWIALETTDDALPCFDFDWPEAGVLVLGNEEYGVSQALLEKCAATVCIPRFGKKNSMNVASAFAVVASQISHRLSSSKTTAQSS